MKNTLFLAVSFLMLTGCKEIFGPSEMDMRTLFKIELEQGENYMVLNPLFENKMIVTAYTDEVVLKQGDAKISFKKVKYDGNKNQLYVKPEESKVQTTDGEKVGLKGHLVEEKSTRKFTTMETCARYYGPECRTYCGPHGCFQRCDDYPIYGQHQVEIEEITSKQFLRLNLINKDENVISLGESETKTKVTALRRPLTPCY